MGIFVFRSYGSSEHPSITGSSRDAPEDKRLFTDGNARPGVEIRLGPDGEIFSRGPDLCLGYTDDALTERAFDADGWYRTGDVGVLDDDGYLTITDRKADVIIRGGENITALEVEEVLLGMPAVAEAVVVAAPDDRLGERAAAVLRVREGHDMPTLDEVREHFKAAGVAIQKWPEELHRVDDYPRTASGKVQKFSFARTFRPELAKARQSLSRHCIEQLVRIGFSQEDKECFMGQLSHRVDIPFPLFDADNHLYEPPEAMTKYLPKEYKDVVQYVEVNGRTKIALKGQISNYIPNPTFSVVAKPGAWEEYFKFGNPDGKSKRELFGEPMRAIPAFFEPAPAPREDGRAGHRPLADVPDAGQPDRGAAERRPGRHPRHHPLAQPVARRGVGLQLPEPHLHHPGDHAAHRREGDRGAGVVRQARCPRHPDPPGTGARFPRPAVVRAARVRPVLGAVRRVRRVRRHALQSTAVTPATPPSGTAPRRRCCRSRPTPCRSSTSGARSRTRWPPG